MGSAQAASGDVSSAARFLPLLPLSVLVILALASGVAYERQASFLDSCRGSVYARSCLAEVQLLQVQATVWIAAAAAVVVLLVIGGAASNRARRLGASPLAILGYGLFLIAWGIVGIFVSQWEGFGQLPRGTGQTFLLIYVASSLVQFAVPRARPRTGGTVARAATLVASAHGVLGTILGLVLAYFLVFPPIIAT